MRMTICECEKNLLAKNRHCRGSSPAVANITKEVAQPKIRLTIIRIDLVTHPKNVRESFVIEMNSTVADQV
jgi:hypothetical protein